MDVYYAVSARALDDDAFAAEWAALLHGLEGVGLALAPIAETDTEVQHERSSATDSGSLRVTVYENYLTSVRHIEVGSSGARAAFETACALVDRHLTLDRFEALLDRWRASGSTC